MARAYLRKGTEDEEVTHKDKRDGKEVERRNLYRIWDCDYFWEDNESRFFTESGEWVDVWWDSDSREIIEDRFVVPSGGPEWMCGVCEAGFYSEDEAVACCQ